MFEPNPQFWNRLAEGYAARPVANPASFERKIAVTKALMGPEQVVLDVGCGTGSLVLRLAGDAAEVHGLDFSSAMVAIGRRKSEAEGARNVRFHEGTLDSELPFANGSLHGLCAYSILHLVPDRAAALRRIMELLKPGGFFVSSTVCLGDSWVPYRPLLAVMRSIGKAPPLAILRARDLQAEIEAAGFVDLSAPDVGAKPEVSFFVARKPR